MQKLSQLALNDEGFAFDPSTGDSFLANSSALLIMKQLREGKRPKEIARAITDKYRVDMEDAARDVADFWLRLKSLGLAEG